MAVLRDEETKIEGVEGSDRQGPPTVPQLSNWQQVRASCDTNLW